MSCITFSIKWTTIHNQDENRDICIVHRSIHGDLWFPSQCLLISDWSLIIDKLQFYSIRIERKSKLLTFSSVFCADFHECCKKFLSIKSIVSGWRISISSTNSSLWELLQSRKTSSICEEFYIFEEHYRAEHQYKRTHNSHRGVTLSQYKGFYRR